MAGQGAFEAVGCGPPSGVAWVADGTPRGMNTAHTSMYNTRHAHSAFGRALGEAADLDNPEDAGIV